MPELNSARERLDAAVEAKGLSSFPSLKRAILRSRFIAMLPTLALPIIVALGFETDFNAITRVELLIDAALSIGAWWFSVSLIKCSQEQQWEKLNLMLDAGAKMVLVAALLTVIGAFVSIMFVQVVAALILALSAVALFVWRNDYVRAREDLTAMLAERGLELAPVDPVQRQIAKRKLQRWMAAAFVLIAVVAGVSWMAVESAQVRDAALAQDHMAKLRAREEQMIAAYEAEKIAKAESDKKNWALSP